MFLDKLKLDSLTTIQKDDLLTKLMEDFDKIKQKFAGLVDDTLQSLRHNDVNLEELKVAVKEYLPNKVHNLFSNAKSLNDMFLEDLSEYWSFFDYELLAFIINRRCKELQGDLDEYIAMFKEYCKRKYSEVPTVFNSKAHERYYNLTVKVHGEFDHITMEQVKEIECQLQKITGLDLSLARIGDGCIELVFISLSGEDDMLPLSVKDKEKLSEMGIFKLYSDKCVYYDNGESSPSGTQLTHPKKLLPDPNILQPAEETVKKLGEEQLNCSICHNAYTDPKLHVFCRDCLVGLAHRNTQGLPCPTCRQVTPIPPAGVAGLQPANRFLEILDQHKKVKQDILYCPQHQNQELELYKREDVMNDRMKSLSLTRVQSSGGVAQLTLPLHERQRTLSDSALHLPPSYQHPQQQQQQHQQPQQHQQHQLLQPRAIPITTTHHHHHQMPHETTHSMVHLSHRLPTPPDSLPSPPSLSHFPVPPGFVRQRSLEMAPSLSSPSMSSDSSSMCSGSSFEGPGGAVFESDLVDTSECISRGDRGAWRRGIIQNGVWGIGMGIGDGMESPSV